MRTLLVLMFTVLSIGSTMGQIRFLRKGSAPSTRELLEPALTLEDAVELAKKNDPRGFYQLAINASKVSSWRRKDGFNAAAYSAYFLKKACDAGYTNAIFAAVLIEDDRMKDDAETYRNHQDRLPRSLLIKYVGSSSIGWKCNRRSLSSSNDVLVIRKRYEDLIAMGIHQATNAIENLGFRAKKNMERAQKWEKHDVKDDEAVALIKSVVALPPQKTEREERIDAAKKCDAIYIGNTVCDDSNAQWSTNNHSKLHVAVECRVFEFSADGRLLSVSQSQE